jgi:glycosyltransferase involved in cell wall biosynthesis
MPKKLLMIAFHYPPCAMSSGLQRTLSFSMHLEGMGWRPVVLSAKAPAYEQTSQSQLNDIPGSVVVSRTTALDAARQLAISGRYWSRLAVPDRWRSWWLTAVPTGMALIKRHSIDAIWSTYPIATAHSIAASLARLSGLPWIADFRDPMVETHPETGELAPRDPSLRKARLRIESLAVRRATKLVFCTRSACRIAQQRYASVVTSERTAIIPNGYEEQVFQAAAGLQVPVRQGSRRLLLHSGTIYKGADRDPTMLFRALQRLLGAGEISPDTFELRLRNPSNEDYFRSLAGKEGVGSLVTVAPAITYREALAEMLGADGLLVLQGITSNPAVPAKLYEYFRARKPIVALVHPDGETAGELRSASVGPLASLTDETEIAAVLRHWLRGPEGARTLTPSDAVTAAYSRQGLTRKLADVLASV